MLAVENVEINESDHVSELLVLSVLDEQEKVQNEQRERMLPFLKGAAMLQTAVEGPQDVIQSMVAELGNISTEENVTMGKIREYFDTEMNEAQREGPTQGGKGMFIFSIM